jgi:hypothetical protein
MCLRWFGGVLEIQGGRRGRPPWGSPGGRGAGVHPGCLPGDRQGSTRLEGSTRDCDSNLPLQHLNSHPGLDRSMHRNNRYKTAASASRPHLRLRIPRATVEEPFGDPLGNTRGIPLGEHLWGSEETSGGTSEETSGRSLGGTLEESLGGTRRPTARHFRTQQSLARRRKDVEACIALPITLLAKPGSKISTTRSTQHQKTHRQKTFDSKPLGM